MDDRISSFLEGTPDAWNGITIRHLLSHTSGIAREAHGFSPLKAQGDAEVIKTAYPLPLRFAPGEKWQYCNVGYFALAEIIRKVSAKPWPEFLNQRIFAPLEMQSTRATTMTEIVPGRADGYDWTGKKHQNAGIHLAVRPSGAFLSNVLDLAKWDAALSSDKALKQSSCDAMWTPVTLNDGTQRPSGFGWYLGALGGHKVVRHGGSISGFRSELARLVDDKLTIIILTNSGGANAPAMAVEVAKHFVPGLLANTAASPEE